MGSLIKWLLGLILVLVLLVVAAAVVLPMVIDPNDYKPQIVAAARDKLGRDFAIEQDLKLSVFPWVGVETGGVRVGNAQGFSHRKRFRGSTSYDFIMQALQALYGTGGHCRGLIGKAHQVGDAPRGAYG